MKKKTVENIAKTLPFALKNATGYFKENFDKSGQDILGNTTGTVGVLVRFFAQDTIDAYFENLTNSGGQVYYLNDVHDDVHLLEVLLLLLSYSYL